MSLLTQNRWFRRFGLGAVAAVALLATTGSMATAQAHDYRYGPGWGYHAPYNHHHYYSERHHDRGARVAFRILGHLFR